jgi:hypothetical protein
MPICQGIVAKTGTKCEKRALGNSYCADHKGQVAGATVGQPVCKGVLIKTGLKCTRSAYGNGYCGYHKGQANVTHAVPTKQTPAVTLIPRASNNTRPVCKGVLIKTGLKCTRSAYDNGYCGYHKGQANVTHVVPTKQTPAVTLIPCASNRVRPARAVAYRKPKDNAVSRHGMVCAAANEQTLLVLQELVDIYSTYDKIFIGKASSGNTPEKRWSQKYESLGYERMQVLCKTPTVEGALWLEKELIAHFKLIDRVNIQNPIAGGGGAKGKAPGYVYLVVG